MIRLFSLLAVLALCSCSSAGVSQVRERSLSRSDRPQTIFVEPFSTRFAIIQLGERSASEKRALKKNIVTDLANRTSRQIRLHAANSSVLHSSSQPQLGDWVVRGSIRKVDQGSRAMRTVVGLGAGRTIMKTKVAVFRLSPEGWQPVISFKTAGTSGLEPGAAPGAAVGGVSLVGTSASVISGSLAGVSSDIDRTAYEISAVLSDYLARHGMLDSRRRAVQPRMKGQIPTTINPERAVPSFLR